MFGDLYFCCFFCSLLTKGLVHLRTATNEASVPAETPADTVSTGSLMLMSLNFLNNKFSVKTVSCYNLYHFKLGKIIFSDALGVFNIHYIFMRKRN